MNSERSRNLLGGFWGGVLGILAFAYMHWLLPIGCLTGVAVGYWHQELGQVVVTAGVQAWRAFVCARAIVRQLLNAVRQQFVAARIGVNARLETSIQWAINFRRKGQALARRYWQKFDHPVNRANVIVGLACISFVALNIFAFYRLLRLDKTGTLEDNIITGAVLLVLTAGPAIRGGVVMGKYWTDRERMQAFYGRWERYSHSKIVLFLHTIVALMRMELAWVLTYVGFFGTMILLGFGVVCFVVLPVLAFFGISRILGQATRRTNSHWVILATTLAVTSVSAYLVQPWLSGLTLWLIALATGCASGLVSDMMVRLFQSEASSWADRSVWDKAGDYLIPVLESAEKLFHRLMDVGAPVVQKIVPSVAV